MKSYLQYITDTAKGYNISLLTAFKVADIPTSTYYRAINKVTELRYDTAVKVINAIERLHAIQQACEYTKGLRASGKDVDRRSVRAKFKPRIISS